MSEKQPPPHPPESVLPVIKSLRTAGWSHRRIADYLQTEGYPSPTRWKGQPARWTVKMVQRLLEQDAPDGPPPSSESQTQPVTFTGPITVVATGPLTFDGPVTMNGPKSSKEETTPQRGAADPIITHPPSRPPCESPHD